MTAGSVKHGLLASFVPVPTDTVEYAVAAEGNGWDGMFQIDNLSHSSVTDPAEVNPINDPWNTWAGVATRTTEIRLGSNITPVPRRQPCQLARNLSTLDRLFEGYFGGRETQRNRLWTESRYYQVISVEMESSTNQVIYRRAPHTARFQRLNEFQVAYSSLRQGYR